MLPTELSVTDIDDPAFVALANSFLVHYFEYYSPRFIYVTHINNWFGERWLGFAGKFKGVAGIRQRRGKLGTDGPSLAIPPFKPSRVISSVGLQLRDDEWSSFDATLHMDKNGGIVHTLYNAGLFLWYSGNTIENTTASLMFYEVNRGGQNAWYLNFEKKDDWQFVSCRNIASEECRKIADEHFRNLTDH